MEKKIILHQNPSFLKTKLSRLLLLIAAIGLLSFADPYTIKRVTDNNFRYEFYTTQRLPSPKDNRMYYWFKGGAIHNSVSGIAGELLNGPYNKLYLSNQLAEQGKFKNGLKTGTWKTWYKNGALESVQRWKKGHRSGMLLRYAEDGKLLEQGRYRNDLKSGKWILAETNDTIAYKKGHIAPKKPKLTKEEKAALKEKKKNEKEAAKRAKQNEQPQKNTKDTEKTKKKDSFWNRLFGKNKTKTQKNAKGT